MSVLIEVYRFNGEKEGEEFTSGYITTVDMALQKGKQLLNENAHVTKETSLSVAYNNKFKKGEFLAITIDGVTQYGKITSVAITYTSADFLSMQLGVTLYEPH